MSDSASLALTKSFASHDSLYIPPELLREIFSHCDVPTLAVVSRVSFACLAASSKLLYEDITLKDAQSIVELLRLGSLVSSLPGVAQRVKVLRRCPSGCGS